MHLLIIHRRSFCGQESGVPPAPSHLPAAAPAWRPRRQRHLHVHRGRALVGTPQAAVKTIALQVNCTTALQLSPCFFLAFEASDAIDALLAVPLCRVHPAALERVPDPMDNIFIETGFDSGTDLVQRLMRLRPLLERSSPVSPRRVRALVIDSIAHLFRDVGDNGGIDQLAGRMEVLFKISSLLR